MQKLSLFLFIAILFVSIPAAAQDDMWPGDNYNPDIPGPEDILGYELGTAFTPHFLLERYIERLDAASDRIIVQTYGTTWQGRTLYHVIISSPENLARIDEIQANIRQLTTLSPGSPEAGTIIADTPAIAMLNYTVHGNEASGTEAAMRTMYQLAAGEDETTRSILENVVTVIDPVQNPDGHDRYVNWINSYIVDKETADPYSMDHSEPWPGGRTNAYYFDLNRDWFLMTQKESWQRVRAVREWLPQVSPDLHEMGSRSTYYFAPPMKPLNHLIRPVTEKWWELYGRSNAAILDEHGVTYYTRESFDYFYSGYGGSLPTYFGSIAMTYEQASTRGRITERPDGTTISLKDGVRNHFLTSMATLRLTAERRQERLEDFNLYFQQVSEYVENQPIKEVYLPPADPMRMNKLVQRLQYLGATVLEAEEAFTVADAYNYFSKEEEEVTLPEGTRIIRIDQPLGLALLTALEPQSPLDEEFINEERERFRRNLPSRFYDITAWSMPLTYGLQAYYGSTASNVATREVETITAIKPESTPVEKARVAYLIPPEGNANIALTMRLFQAGYKLRAARLEFTLNDKVFAPGTIVIRVIRNPETLHDDINRFIEETGGTAYAAQTGYTPSGIDLGSNNVRHIESPKVLLVGDDPVSSYAFGHLRYLFEQLYDVDYTAMRSADLAYADLSKYNVIILPHMRRASSFENILGSRGVDQLKNWIRDGNVLIAFAGAVDFLRSKDVGLTSAPKYSQRRKQPGDVDDPYQDVPADQAEEESAGKTDGGKEKEQYEVERLMRVPGAIARVRLDDRSFLSWGYPDLFVAALVNSSDVYEPLSDDQGIAAARYYGAGEILLSGHMWEESLELLPGKAYAWHEDYGGGMVISFAEEPYFRASYDGLDRLIFNAIIYPLAFTR